MANRQILLLGFICILIGLSIWQTSKLSVLEIDMEEFSSSLVHDSSVITDDDPVTAYANNIDLSQVPPFGRPPNLPAAKATEGETSKFGYIREKHGYGGGGDKAHLGGFTTIDPQGISPYLWKEMMEYFGVKTLLDVGCGRGFSTSWFFMQGVDVQCVEGSHDAIESNVLPDLIRKKAEEEGRTNKKDIEKEISRRLVEHDFSLGPYWPETTVDAVWSVELLEHIGRNYQKNYLTAFKKAAFLFVTHSRWGGWHHTEVHDDKWWISRLEMYGFNFSADLTQRARKIVANERSANIPFPRPLSSAAQTYKASHLSTNLLVFMNPQVASRLDHSHLMSEPGCYNGDLPNAHCGDEKNPRSRAVNTPIPDEFKFIPYKEEVHNAWEAYIKEIVPPQYDQKR